MTPNTIKIDDVVYVREDQTLAQTLDGMEYVIVRTARAGVFAGYKKSFDDSVCTLMHARRLWRWAGAASLSQLCMEGVKLPEKCMFPTAVVSVILPEVIEILSVTAAAKASIEGVPVWKV